MANINGYGVPSITNTLESGMKDINQGIRSLRPIRQQPVQQPQPAPVPQPQPVVYPTPPQPQHRDSIDKARVWFFWILVIVVAGTAAALIIWNLISRFTGG